MITQVIKRDGRIADFSRANIESAIRKAARATNATLDVITVSNYVIKNIEERFKEQIPSVEQIQDVVEKSLVHFDCPEAAKAYIIYRKKKTEERDGLRLVNVNKLVEDYIDNKDWRVRENANAGYSVSGLAFHIAGDIIAKYSLNKYPKEIRDAHLSGAFHLHDLSLGLICQYCNGLSLEQLIIEGIDGVPGKTSSKPAGHLSSICSHMLNFLGTCQLEAAGAESYSSIDTLLAPFVKKDNLSYKEVKQNIQSLFFNLNVPSRWSLQPPFSNFTLDLTLPDDKKGDIPLIGGKEMSFTYDDCIEEMNMLNRAMMEVMIEGDKHSQIFTFPIITFNIDNEFDWNGPNTDYLFEATAKYGPFYFANFMNSGLKKSDIRSMCLPGSTELIYKTESGRISKIPIYLLVKYFTKSKDYKILNNGEFVDLIDAFEVDYKKYNKKIVEIKTRNNIEEYFSLDHKQDVMRDGKIISIYSQDIKIGDKIPLSKYGYKGPDIGDYELGFFIGCYVGDGYKRPGICICLTSHERKNKVKEVCDNIAKRLGSWSTVDNMPEKTAFRVTIHSEAITTLIEEYVKGNDCYSKRLTNNWIDRSEDFRRGIFDGVLETDGFIRRKDYYGHKNDYRLIHTNNKELVYDLRNLSNSLGIKTTIYSHTNTNSTGRFISHDLKILNYNGWLSNILIEFDDKYWVDIVDVKIKKHTNCKNVYNITVANNDHKYELASSVITHNCCRLSLNLNELRNKMGGVFGSGDKTGSVGVVTINLAQLGYISNDEKEMFDRLDVLLNLAKNSLEIKRRVITENMNKGLMPYTKYYLGSFRTYFSTIGIIGMNELLLNFMNVGIWDKEGKKLGLKIMDHIRGRLVEFQQETGNLYNLEATPAEGTTRRLANIDKKNYPSIIVANEENWKKGFPAYYTNSTSLPVDYTNDLFESLDIEEEFLTKYTGGCVKHIYLGERLPSSESAKNLVRKVCENYRIPYISLTPTFSCCKTHGYINGSHETCPKEI